MLFGAGEDNDPKHTAQMNKQWFVDNEIELMDWPS
jgi:hypothetical protein